MCFSAAASFTAAATLVPLGLAAGSLSLRQGQGALLPLALVPVFFGLQQALEGVVWLTVEQEGGSIWLSPAALGYLFFAYLFWLVWIPWSALRLERSTPGLLRRPAMLGLLCLGLLIGVLLWLPLLLDPGRLAPAVVKGSLAYNARLLGDGWINLRLGSFVYGLIITLPLLLLPQAGMRIFGITLVLSYVLSQLMYVYAFTSVWCFFSALLSGMILWLVLDSSPPEVERTPTLSAANGADCGPGEGLG
jgi:hypothetical protein